ncbi:MAG: amidohydrolase family protein [Candidatus Nanopelagicales bacterium]
MTPLHDPRPATQRPVDLLIAHATVVTVDPHDRVVEDGAVAVSDGRIAWVGPTAEAASAVAAAETVDARGGILLPGLVNAHTHLAMTLFRGLADDRDLQAFLGVVVPAESAVLSRDTVTTGVELAVAESFLAGSTAALDMYFFHEAARNVASRSGFRLHAGPVLVGPPGPDGRTFADRMRWAEADLAATDGPRWLMPHSTYLLDPGQLAEIGLLARRYDARVHIHAAENAAEVADVRHRFGGTPIDVLEGAGLLDPQLTMAHAVVLTDDEVARIAAAGSVVVHCPASNLKLASGFCRTSTLAAAGVTLALGTDGAASSNDLDLFRALRLAAVVDPAYVGDAARMPASTVLRAGTAGGAAALGIADRVGSVEVGKQADLLLLDGDSPALTPCPDPTSAVVYAASRADVRSVWVDGRAVLADRRLTTLDLPSVLAAARALGPMVQAAAGRG